MGKAFAVTFATGYRHLVSSSNYRDIGDLVEDVDSGDGFLKVGSTWIRTSDVIMIHETDLERVR